MNEMPELVEAVGTAREAASRHAWRVAYEAFSSASGTELGADDLERFAAAAWWTGKLEEAIALRERAFAAYAAAGDRQHAARLALALSWDYSGRGSFAVSNGWFAKGERLLDKQLESPEHAQLALTRGVNTLFAGHPRDALVELDRAAEIGDRLGDRDTEALALTAKGRALVKLGETERGLALLDEATASAVSGELDPYSTGLIYCITISSCQDLGDYRRAAEWTEVANKWCDRLDVSGFPGACRIHRAEIMRLRGDLVAAERQAIAACDELRDFERSITAGGYYEIGEIRRRLGDFAAAEEAYATADELGRLPQPGLALLRLAQGKVDAAVAGITRALNEIAEPLARVRNLPAQVEIALAADDVVTARAAAEELERIVDAYKIGDRRAPAFDATVHVSFGRIKLAEADPEGAERCLRRAGAEWHEVGAPYETAQARMLLGIAFRRQRDEHAATAEFEAALSTFERLGAKLDAARAQELLGRLQTRRTFMFTDIVDSTRLLDALGDEKWKKLLARHDALVRDRIAGAGGEVIKETGDGFFAAFDNPLAAVDAAIAIQRALADEVVAPDVRIGAHTGGALRKNADATDYAGEAVHVAARVGAAARAGEILFSRESLDGLQTAFCVSEPREEFLKGFGEPVALVAVEWR